MNHTEVLNSLRAYYLLDPDEQDEIYDGMPLPHKIEDVLGELGCMAVLGPDDEGGPGFRASPAPPPAEAAYVRATLLEIYDGLDGLMDAEANPRLSLLHGLCRNDVWRECLVEPRDPLKFAHLVLFWAGRIAMWPYSMRSLTEPDVVPVLNKWLKPAEPWSMAPSVELLCAGMFGPSWWAVRRPDLAHETFEICERVLAERIEFQAGVIPGGSQSQVMDLPSFG